jgi:hypothetical protein
MKQGWLNQELHCEDCVCVHTSKEMSRDNVVGIATGYGLDDRGVGVRVLVGSRIFSSPRRPDRSGVHAMGTGGSFLRGTAAGA